MTRAMITSSPVDAVRTNRSLRRRDNDVRSTMPSRPSRVQVHAVRLPGKRPQGEQGEGVGPRRSLGP